ncbi:MCE family protein [Gordonia sp. NPDC003425]
MKRLLALVAVVLVAVVGAVAWFTTRGPDSKTISVQLASATGLYPGDEVTVLGVPVGKVESLTPTPGYVIARLSVNNDVEVPSNAGAAVVSQSLVAGRTIQLTPGYTGGATLADGAVIPLARTTVPMEWDDIKNALNDVTRAVGSKGPDDPGSAAQLVSSAADTLSPNADDVNNTITGLSRAMSVISDGRDDLFAVVRNLQVFVNAMSGSNDQVAALQQRLSTVAQVLGDTSGDTRDALATLDTLMGDVQTFVSQNRDAITSDMVSATDVTTTLALQRANIEGLLHQSPTQLSNFFNIYKPGVGGMNGVFSAANFENPVQAVCGGFAAVGKPDSGRAADLCVQYLGAYLSMLKTSYPNFLTMPTRSGFVDPGQLVYSEPGLAQTVPGLTGPGSEPRKTPRSLSALLLPRGGQ